MIYDHENDVINRGQTLSRDGNIRWSVSSTVSWCR